MNKLVVSFWLTLFTLCVNGQGSKTVQGSRPNTSVTIRTTDDGRSLTSELPLIKIGMNPGLLDAQFSAMYFGPQSDGDISFVVALKERRSRYNDRHTFGIKLFAGDIELNAKAVRLVRVSLDHRCDEKECTIIPGSTVLSFHVTTEEVAWLATAKNITMKTYNSDSETVYDTLAFTPTALGEYRRFAESVLLIKSKL